MLMKKIRKSIRLLMVLCSCLFLFSLTVYAKGTLMSWDGSGIHSKESVDNFTVNSKTKIKISSNISWNSCYPNVPTLYLNLQKKGMITFSTVQTFTHTGLGNEQFTTSIDKGTYRMYFQSAGSPCTIDKLNITGSVSEV